MKNFLKILVFRKMFIHLKRIFILFYLFINLNINNLCASKDFFYNNRNIRRNDCRMFQSAV